MGSILTALPASQEGPARGRPPGSPQVEAMLRELGELWEDLQRKHQENGIVLQEIDKVCGVRVRVGTGLAPVVAACWGSPGEAGTCGAWSCCTGTDVSGCPCRWHASLTVLPQAPPVGCQHGSCSSGWLRARLMGSLLSLKALRLVGELDQAERWLQDVSGSLLEPAAMRSPEELRQDLEEMSQLEKQLRLCGLKLQALREEAAGESPTEHDGTRKMQRKVEMVEEK